MGKGSRLKAVETFFANIVFGILALAAGSLSARLLGPDGKGELAVIQVVGNLIATVGTLGFYEAIVYYASKDKAKGPPLVVSATSYLILAALLLGPIIVSVVPYILPSSRVGVIHSAQVFIFVFPAFVLFGAVQSLLQANLELRRWNVIRGLPSLLWLAAILATWFFADALPERIVLFYVLALNVAGLTVLLFHYRRWISGLPPRLKNLRPLFKFGLPLALKTGPQQLSLRLDIVLMAAFMPAQDIGYYSVAASWSMILMPLPGALASVLFPRLSGESDKQKRATLEKQIFAWSAAVLMIGALFLASVTSLVVPFLFGSQFSKAVPYALGLLFSGWIYGLVKILSSMLQSRGMTKPLLLAEFIGLIATVVGLLLLVPAYSVWGAVVASTIAYLAILGMLSAYLLRARASRAVS